MTIEELNDEIKHFDKEVRLFEYEVKNFGASEDTRARLDTLVKKQIELTMLAITLSHQ